MTKSKWVVAIPKVKTAILGWPAIVELSERQAVAMARYVLGGVEALRTTTYKCAPSTVRSLQSKGLLGTHGLTDLGKDVGKSLADEGLV